MNRVRHDLRHVCFEGTPHLQRERNLFCGSFKSSVRAADALDEQPDGFCSWVLEQAGLNAAAYRCQSLRRRLPACLRALKVHSADDARWLLESNPHLIARAIGSLLIGVTEFFREPAVFEYLRTHILPPLAETKKQLRIWSAACSTGAELYSMAILLEDAGLLDRSYLLGTDCRGEAIEDAERGLYDAAALKCVSGAIRDRYFEPAGRRWKPVKTLRDKMNWKIADLLTEVEEGSWDIILWRNAAIYLKFSSAEIIWRQLASALAPQGVLISGKAERPPVDQNLMRKIRCVYRSKSTPPNEHVGDA